MKQAKEDRRTPTMPVRGGWRLWALAVGLTGVLLVAVQSWDQTRDRAMVVIPVLALLVSVIFGGAIMAMRLRSQARAGNTLAPPLRGSARGRRQTHRSDDPPPTIHSAPTEFDPTALDDPDALDFDPDVVPAATRVWTLSLLESLEWQRFDAVCVAYYTQKAISHRALPLAHAQGCDVYLYQDKLNLDKATGLVHVRSRGVTHLDVPSVRELIGAMTHEQIERGFLMTNGRFTAQARALGREHGIVLVDGRVLLAMIERLPSEARSRLHAIATEGGYTTPSCPTCGEKMVNATGSHGDYWGCRHYPECTTILPRRPALD